MYASLPRHFTMELAVKTVEQEPDLVAERRELLASKSVSELSQVKKSNNFLTFHFSFRSSPWLTSQCLMSCNVYSTKAWGLWEVTKVPKTLQRKMEGKEIK